MASIRKKVNTESLGSVNVLLGHKKTTYNGKEWDEFTGSVELSNGHRGILTIKVPRHESPIVELKQESRSGATHGIFCRVTEVKNSANSGMGGRRYGR